MRTIFIFSMVILVAAACTRRREPAAVEASPTLPPVEFTGVPIVPADQPPIVRTDKGFATTTLPGIPPAPIPPPQYIIYTGPSN